MTMDMTMIERIESLLVTSKISFSGHNDQMISDCFQQIASNLSLLEQVIILTQVDGTVITSAGNIPSEMHNKITSKRINLEFEALTIMSSEINISSKKTNLFSYVKTPRLFDKNYLILLFSSESDKSEPKDLLIDVNTKLSNQIAIFEKYDTINHKIIHALDNIEEAITFCDKDGHLLFANNKCCEILNTSRTEIQDLKADAHTDIKPILMQVLESKKKIVDAEYFMKYRNNTFHLTASAYPVYGNKDEIIGAIDLFQNIERTRKLASSIAGYQAIFTFDHIIGHSEIMEKTKKLAQLFAKYNENVLITGESGTGKELFAQSIHNFSKRSDKPFIAINCANFPNDLIDSELFGYEEGAFTGALKGGKPGKFEVADGGTLFLDEIGEMQFHLQAKLLRVLETMTINRIGSIKPIKVDVRIIAATNQNLEQLVNEGKFRKDLYYRLKVLFLEIPSLKERGEDIHLLAEHFIRSTVERSGKQVLGLTEKAKKLLLTHNNWAGNVRELENMMSRSVYICEEEWITETILRNAGMVNLHSEPVYVRKNVHLSKELIADTYTATGGNKKRTAEILSISRPTLYKLLKKYNLD